jgi:hypothetical protein
MTDTGPVMTFGRNDWRSEAGQVTVWPGIATVAYLGEQVPDFGNPFVPTPRQQRAKYAGVQGFGAIVLMVRQIDATNPAFDPASTRPIHRSGLSLGSWGESRGY